MRKVKRFAAIVLTAALLSPTTAYAGNVEDAKALYEQVTEKQKSVTDMNAYYDYQIHLSGSALEGVEDLSNMRSGNECADEPFNRHGKSAVQQLQPCHSTWTGTDDQYHVL